MGKELKGLLEEPKAKIHIDLLGTTLKHTKLENSRSLWLPWILVQEIHLYDRLAIEMNRYILEAEVPEWMPQVMTTLIQKQKETARTTTYP